MLFITSGLSAKAACSGGKGAIMVRQGKGWAIMGKDIDSFILGGKLSCPENGKDLAVLFDCYLKATQHGLTQEADQRILDTLGASTLARIKRLAREANACSLFYG